MSSDQGTEIDERSDEAAPEPDELTSEQIGQEVSQFLARIVKAPVPLDQDLFATGLVPSIVAMELVVHLEVSYGIAITGVNLRLDNFRTVERIIALVRELREQPV